MGRSHTPREKRFTYADRTGKSQAEHVKHWLGFKWSAGNVVVKARGIWGECQVWASSEAEGKRVIRHGLTFGGFNPDDPSQGSWSSAEAKGRNGQPGTYGLAITRYGALVSKRDGPNGQPERSWTYGADPDVDP